MRFSIPYLLAKLTNAIASLPTLKFNLSNIYFSL